MGKYVADSGLQLLVAQASFVSCNLAVGTRACVGGNPTKCGSFYDHIYSLLVYLLSSCYNMR